MIEERGTWSKDKLAKKIVEHYWVHEIGLETVGLFKHQAKVAMQEIMEEKLPLIYSASIKYDPLVNVDFTRNLRKKKNSQDGNADGLNVNSDTPQGQISKQSILAGNYAAGTGASEGTSHSEGSQSWTRTQRVIAVASTAQKLVQQYRENIIMIDRDILKIYLSSLCVYIEQRKENMAHFTKGQGVFLPPFQAWLANNIPAVYDNTLSYYEELMRSD